MTRPDREMQCYHDGNEPPSRWPVWRVFRWAGSVLLTLFFAFTLISCASLPKHAPADDDGLWEIRNHYPMADGVKGPSRDLFKFIAGPGCRDFGSKVICPDRGTGWQFVAEIERGRVIATWQQRRV